MPPSGITQGWWSIKVFVGNWLPTHRDILKFAGAESEMKDRMKMWNFDAQPCKMTILYLKQYWFAPVDWNRSKSWTIWAVNWFTKPGVLSMIDEMKERTTLHSYIMLILDWRALCTQWIHPGSRSLEWQGVTIPTTPIETNTHAACCTPTSNRTRVTRPEFANHCNVTSYYRIIL